MNITESIAKDMCFDVVEYLRKTPQIQVYSNSSIGRYQWRDSRFIDTSDVWDNESYETRGEMITALKVYLEFRDYLKHPSKYRFGFYCINKGRMFNMADIFRFSKKVGYQWDSFDKYIL